MLPDEFVKQLKPYAEWLLIERKQILYDPSSLSKEMTFNDEMGVLAGPFPYGFDVVEFFKNEGYFVSPSGYGLCYRVSIYD